MKYKLNEANGFLVFSGEDVDILNTMRGKTLIDFSDHDEVINNEQVVTKEEGVKFTFSDGTQYVVYTCRQRGDMKSTFWPSLGRDSGSARVSLLIKRWSSREGCRCVFYVETPPVLIDPVCAPQLEDSYFKGETKWGRGTVLIADFFSEEVANDPAQIESKYGMWSIKMRYV